MLPSPEQTDIYNFIRENRTTSLNVIATAGSGKSTTLVGCAKALPSGLALAFNKSAAQHLSSRLPSVWDAKTFHACAYRACRDAFPHRELTTAGGKRHRDYNPIARLIGRNSDKDIYTLIRATDYAREIGVGLDCGPTNSEPTWERIILENCNRTPQKLDLLIAEMPAIFHSSQFEQDSDIRFGDMVYWCIAHALPLRTYKHILVDEAQDLSPPQIEFLRLLCSGRVVAFGDPHQAIYGFRGSSLHALTEIQDAFNSSTLPLATSFRCAKEVVREARNYSPSMQAHSSNVEGEVREVHNSLNPETLPEWENTAILCRNNAPLISAALRFLAKKIKVQVRSGLRRTIENLFQYEFKCVVLDDLEDVYVEMCNYFENERKEAEEREMWSRLVYLQDLQDCCEAILESFDHPGEWRYRLGDLFDDPKGLVFSTIHRAKGLEWDNVIFYQPNLIPSPHASTPDALQQEDNLAFVVITRAKKSLTYWNEI